MSFDTPDILGAISHVDAMFPEISIAKRGEYINMLQEFIYGKFLKSQDAEVNLIYLQRNCGKNSNPYIQYFILSTFGDAIQPDKCVFVIPAVLPNPKKNYPGHPAIAKPITFFTNIYPQIMLEFLTKRPELLSIVAPNTNETILHQWDLDFKLLSLAYDTNKALVTVRDKQGRIPLHHKNFPHSLVTKALQDYPELSEAVDCNGVSCREMLGLK